MKIESVDFFYVSMPEVLDIGDGSQDALLVRISAGGNEGWGECEASPLTTIASYVCPMSHSACKPVKYSLEGERIESVNDIYRISNLVHENSLDLLQADHTLSGIDTALWDLFGKMTGEPVYRLLGYNKANSKVPYASQLFGDTPQESFDKALKSKTDGYKAVKFGWGPFGTKGLKADIEQLHAVREGLGKDILLMVDAGTVWNGKVDQARERLAALKSVDVFWLEEPFRNLYLEDYKSLSESTPKIDIAGGEGCNNFAQAQAMIKYAGIKFIQIDVGRVGGISAAKQVADLALVSNVFYVNHTFTSNLALSASLQPYAGIKDYTICEYPVELKPLAKEITKTSILPDENGYINVPDKPGLGVEIDTQSVKKYLIDTEIKIGGKRVYITPDI
ncbi:mandelate racemase/muconate lactonizing enzyme family protein [Mariniphaga sediminis]|uniref:mandelate racemase/muconate lactonizing enzyme family protein n=1 Tax=Mariniphaga sediminis TaxID=1628158 RepID=UPI003564098B